MKKLLLTLPFVLGAAWAGTSYYSGQKIEEAYDTSLAELTRSSGLNWEKENYEAGIVNSTATSVLKIPGDTENEYSLRLLHNIRHTPLAFEDSKLWSGAAKVKTTLLLEDTYPEDIQTAIDSFTADEPLVINTDVEFDGSSRSKVIISEALHDNDERSLSLAESVFNVEVNGDHITMTGNVGEFSVDGVDQGTMLASGGTLDTDIQRVAAGIYTGKSDFTLDTFKISSPQVPAIEMRALSANYLASIENDKYTGGLVYAIEELKSPLPLNSMSLDIFSRGVSVDRWAEFSEVYEEAITTDEGMVDMPLLKTALLNLLEAESGIDIALKMENEGGNAVSTLDIDVVPSTSDFYPAGGAISVTTLRELIQLFTAELSINADASAIDITPLAVFLQSPMAQQIVVSDGSSYKVAVSISDMLMTLNGNSIPLEQLVPIDLDTPIDTILGD